MAVHPGVGDRAPSFELAGTAGPFSLAAQRGRRVILLFFPAAESLVCTRQFKSYRDRADELAALDAVVVGVSDDDLEADRAFVAHHGLTVPLLADSEGRVASLYGLTSRVVGTRRATIVVDEQGIIRHRSVHLLGARFDGVEDLAAAIAKLPIRPESGPRTAGVG